MHLTAHYYQILFVSKAEMGCWIHSTSINFGHPSFALTQVRKMRIPYANGSSSKSFAYILIVFVTSSVQVDVPLQLFCVILPLKLQAVSVTQFDQLVVSSVLLTI